MLREENRRLYYNIQTAMDDSNGEPKERDATNEVPTESPTVLGSREQQASAGHSDGGGGKPTYKQQIAKWFRKHFGGHRMLEWLTFAFEVLTFAALCIYSYFSYGQWQAMRDQIYVMTLGVGQTQHMLDQTTIQTRAAQSSAIAAQDAIAQSRSQFVKDQRPYVWLASDGLGSPQFWDTKNTNPATGQVIWEYHFTNFGKGPARDLQIHQSIKIGALSKFVESYHIGPVSYGNGTLPPIGNQKLDAVGAPGTPREEFSRLLAADHGITLRVRFDYRDASGCRYETHVCISKLATGAIQYCPEENYITECLPDRSRTRP